MLYESRIDPYREIQWIVCSSAYHLLANCSPVWDYLVRSDSGWWLFATGSVVGSQDVVPGTSSRLPVRATSSIPLRRKTRFFRELDGIFQFHPDIPVFPTKTAKSDVRHDDDSATTAPDESRCCCQSRAAPFVLNRTVVETSTKCWQYHRLVPCHSDSLAVRRFLLFPSHCHDELSSSSLLM